MNLDIESLLAARARLVGEQPPPGLRERLVSLFDERSAAVDAADPVDPVDPADPFVVELAAFFDSYRDEPLAATRGPGDGKRRLAYTCSTADVVVDLARSTDGTVEAVGQVFLRDRDAVASGPRRASAAHRDVATAPVPIDATGHFTIDDVPADVGSIRVELGEVHLVLTVASKLDGG